MFSRAYVLGVLACLRVHVFIYFFICILLRAKVKVFQLKTVLDICKYILIDVTSKVDIVKKQQNHEILFTNILSHLAPLTHLAI